MKTLVQIVDDVVVDPGEIIALYQYGDGRTKIYLTNDVVFQVHATVSEILDKLREAYENG